MTSGDSRPLSNHSADRHKLLQCILGVFMFALCVNCFHILLWFVQCLRNWIGLGMNFKYNKAWQMVWSVWERPEISRDPLFKPIIETRCANISNRNFIHWGTQVDWRISFSLKTDIHPKMRYLRTLAAQRNIEATSYQRRCIDVDATLQQRHLLERSNFTESQIYVEGSQ